MFPKEIEVILARHLASYLAMPIAIVDDGGNIIFFNEPAEVILGRRFDEVGEIATSEWLDKLLSVNESGQTLGAEERPVMVALKQRRPSHHRLWLRSMDGVMRHIETTAFPLIGQADRHLGVMAIFWEVGGNEDYRLG